MKRQKVLIVDDEESIVLGLLRVLYQDNGEYDVLLARSAEIAQAIMQELDIDVMITDVRMQGMSGLELLCWAGGQRTKTRVIVMTAYDTAELQHQAYASGCLRVVQKPFDAHRVRQLIRECLRQDQAFAGSLANLAPADVIQMLCLGRKTTGLRVLAGEDVGLVAVQDGEIVHAMWNEISGEEAIYEILRATSGKFETIPFPEGVPTTIQQNWQYLLMEGMRIEDEVNSGRRTSDRKVKGWQQPEANTDVRTYPSASAPRSEAARALRNRRSAFSAVPEAEEVRTEVSPIHDPVLTSGDGANSGGGSWATAVRQREHERLSQADRDLEVSRLIDEGFALLRQRNKAGARQAWEQARTLDPGNRSLEVNLRKLGAG